jgi:hypothetical protein
MIGDTDDAGLASGVLGEQGLDSPATLDRHVAALWQRLYEGAETGRYLALRSLDSSPRWCRVTAWKPSYVLTAWSRC